MLDASGRNLHIQYEWRKNRRWRHITTREKEIYLWSGVAKGMLSPSFFLFLSVCSLDARGCTNEQFLCKRTLDTAILHGKTAATPVYAKHHELNFWSFKRARARTFHLSCSFALLFPRSNRAFSLLYFATMSFECVNAMSSTVGSSASCKSRFANAVRGIKRDAKKIIAKIYNIYIVSNYILEKDT